MGSEMCIRDRAGGHRRRARVVAAWPGATKTAPDGPVDRHRFPAIGLEATPQNPAWSNTILRRTGAVLGQTGRLASRRLGLRLQPDPGHRSLPPGAGGAPAPWRLLGRPRLEAASAAYRAGRVYRVIPFLQKSRRRFVNLRRAKASPVTVHDFYCVGNPKNRSL